MKFRIVALVVAAASLLAVSTAHAVPTLSLVWRQSGSATVGTPSSDVTNVVVADVVLTADTIGVIGVFLSIEFDAKSVDLPRSDDRELTAITGWPLSGAARRSPFLKVSNLHEV